MLEQLIEWDKDIFLFLNAKHSAFLDIFMWVVSSKEIWVPSILAFLYVIFKDKRKEIFLIIFHVFLLILISDQISSSIFKPLVERLRPSREPSLEGLVHIVNNYKGGKYGFLSSHSANAFSFALFSSLLFKHRFYTFVIFIWAALNSYSRIYLGVHYPLDIIAGMFLGLSVALGMYYLYKYIKKMYPSLNLNVNKKGYTKSGYAKQNISLLLLTLLLTFIVLFISALKCTVFIV